MFHNVHGLTVAHDLDASQEMFEMDGLFYDELPERLRPMKRYSNRKELVFENPDDVGRRTRPGLRSRLRVATASDRELGRSKEIHLLHCSEGAFWDHAETTMLSVRNSVAYLPGTVIFIESTPNGVGNYFHREYEAAKNGDSDYFSYFMAWYEFAAHWMALDGPPEEFEDTLDANPIYGEESAERVAYNLSLEQLNWRRWCIREQCGRDVEKFKQEYPSDDVSCFLLSGRGYFDGKMMMRMLKATKEPPFIGNLVEDPRTVLGVRLEPHDKGFIKIWKPPQNGRRYVIGGDVAEGLAHGDFSVGAVHDWETMDQVAEWHGHIDADLFGGELARLGTLYNRALIACEDNNRGAVTNGKLRRLGYPHLFYRQELDDRTKRKTARLGWLTTPTSKPVLLAALNQACRDGADMPNKELIKEMTTFIVHDDGRLGAEEGCHDDRVISSGIAAEARRTWGIDRYFPSAGR